MSATDTPTDAPTPVAPEQTAATPAGPRIAGYVSPTSSTPTPYVDRIMDLPDRVLEIARTDPQRAALIHVRRSLTGRHRVETTTYADLSRRAESIAVGLRRIGVGEQTLVSFMIPPCEDALAVALALWRVGAVMVGIEPHSHGLRKVTRCLERVGPTVFVGTPEAQAGRIAFGWGRRTIKTNIAVGGLHLPGAHMLASLESEPGPLDPPSPDVTVDDPAVVAFTTGSTGTPKPTVMTHRNLTAMIDGVAGQWRLAEGGDVIDMPTFPIFWIIGLFHGGTVVVPPMNFATAGPGSANPAKLVDTIRTHEVASLFGSPAVLTNIAAHCNSNGLTLPSVRRIVAGGAEVYGPLYAAVRKAIPNGEIYSNYGATEALPVAEIAGAEVLSETWARTEAGEGLCVGRPLAGVEVKIIEIDDGPIESMADAVELPLGRVGEVIVRSPHVSDHYFDAPDDMRDNKIPDGDTRWHRLGDCGFVDDEGRLWVCGRRSHRVVGAEQTYFPLQTEPVFNTHPDVVRSALTGPKVGGGVTPTVFVELTSEARARQATVEAELSALAEEHDSTRGLGRFVFIDKLPVDRRHNAKIDRPALARRAEGAALKR